MQLSPESLHFNLPTSGCTINVNADLSEPQPLLIRPRASAFVYPNDRAGLVHLDDGEEIEIYCSDGLVAPSGAGNSAIVRCVDGNQFAFNGLSYDFKNFSCNSYPFHTTRRRGKCFNEATRIEIGFDLGNRFVKVLEVCHDEVTEETFFAKFQLTPASEG
jgi:hypothetical protein